METPEHTTDTDYWERLNSNAYDEYDDLEAKADRWERAFYGHASGGSKKVRRERLTNKWIEKIVVRERAPPILCTAEVETSAPVQASQLQRVTQPQTTTPTGAAEVRTGPVSSSAQFNAKKAHEAAQKHNAAFRGVQAVQLRNLDSKSESLLVAAYDHMMETFDTPRFASAYGGCGVSNDLRFDVPVPSYFANVGGESIARRKALSIAGLRNLVRYGPVIFKQLESQLFAGRPDSYRAGEGLNLMRTMTGNVVDLDTTVLRCDQTTLAVINMSNAHKGLPIFSTTHEFSLSQQAREIAISCAAPLLTSFAEKFGLSREAAAARCVSAVPAGSIIPISSDNTTRGHTPLWHYVNAGQNSFHVNVPAMDDVVGALLRAPFACVEHYASLHVQYTGAALEKELEAFFADCVADSCFNMKWKAIEEFGAALAHKGTIVDCLQKVQMQFQEIFTEDFFEQDASDHSNEIAEMVKLTSGKSARDRYGCLRAITRDDIEKWVRAMAEGKAIVI